MEPYAGPIANYLPYLWASMVLGVGALTGFLLWLVKDCMRLRRQLDTLEEK